MTRTRIVPIAMLVTLTVVGGSSIAQESAAKWLWYPEDAASDAREQARWFRYAFELPQAPARASLWLMVDDRQTLWVNGDGPLEPDERDTAAWRYDLTRHLRAGANLLSVEAWNATSVAGVIARLTLRMPDGTEATLTSDDTWRVSREAPESWTAIPARCRQR